MSFTYVATNLITVDTLSAVTTEDAVYVKEYLYNERPSKPFRFTSELAQDIRVDLGAATKITHASIFNHDLVGTGAFALDLQGNAADAWGAPTYDQALTWKDYSLYEALDETFQWWRLYVNDPDHTTSPQIGEFVLGVSATLSNGNLLVDEGQDLDFAIAGETTYFGQDWDYYLSDSMRFTITFQNLNDPANIDELETFARDIGGPGGRFVYIPNTDQPYCFYVKIENTSIPNRRMVMGTAWEKNEWTMTLKVLVRGIRLL